MKKMRLVAVAAIVLLISALVATRVVEVVKANPSSFARLFDNVVITVQSPENKTYNMRTLPLNFTVETNNDYQPPASYILNNGKPVEVATRVVSQRIVTSWYWEGGNHTYDYTRFTAQGNAVLPSLADGTYNLTIQRYGNPAQPLVSTNVSFTIDTASPSVRILNPENRAYNATSVSLNFELTEPSTACYSLDGEANVIASGNMTLTGLTEGSHSIAVYANDTAGNMGKSDMVYFAVQANPSTPSSPASSPSSSSSLSPSPSPSQNPATSSVQTHSIPQEVIFTVAGTAVILAAGAAAVMLRKKKQTNAGQR
jgi:hypothetical protein